MTIYVCQCPHLRPASVWTAASENDVIDAIVGDTENSFDSALDAAQYDMRDAYVTDDPFDLALWIAGNEAPQATGAQRALFANREVVSDIEAVATCEGDRDDTIVYTAFDGRFTWFEDEGGWRLGNREPVEADDLAHALVDAHRAIAFERAEQIDV